MDPDSTEFSYSGLCVALGRTLFTQKIFLIPQFPSPPPFPTSPPTPPSFLQAVGGHGSVHPEASVQGTQPRNGQVMTLMKAMLVAI